MRSLLLLAVSGLGAAGIAPQVAAAQTNPPLQEMQAPPQGTLLPPSLRPTTSRPPAAATPAAVTQGAPELQGVPPPDMTPQLQWPNKWLPAGTVRLHALDKVNAQVGTLTVKVGQTATFESLTVTVRACAVRPPDQPADAAAYLEVTDSHPDSPGFAGWMLQNEPSVSMMQSPIYDIRVAGCS